MELRSKPKLTIGLLLVGTLVLIGGGAYAASRKAPDRMMMLAAMSHETHASPPAIPRSAVPVNSPPPRAVVTQGRSGKKRAHPAQPATHHNGSRKRPSITYVVKAGDTLSGIAKWFRQHGYGRLYRANRAVIGGNPNLIRPGEHITIARGVMTMFSSK